MTAPNPLSSPHSDPYPSHSSHGPVPKPDRIQTLIPAIAHPARGAQELVRRVARMSTLDMQVGLFSFVIVTYSYLFVSLILHLQPMCAFFGGVVAQELVKLSGKFTPLQQW